MWNHRCICYVLSTCESIRSISRSTEHKTNFVIGNNDNKMMVRQQMPHTKYNHKNMLTGLGVAVVLSMAPQPSLMNLLRCFYDYVDCAICCRIIIL